jgi:D-3-phosphoglycerate dehydrogenase
MKIVIPDDYQDTIHKLDAVTLLAGHEITRYRTPARDLDELVERLKPAEIVVEIRERIDFSRALIERLPNLKLIALVGSRSQAIDYEAAKDHQVLVSTGKSGSPEAPAELAVALMLASRRNVVVEAPRMRAGEWPSTLSYRLRGSTLGIFGLGKIGQLVAAAGHGLGMKVLVWGRENSLKEARAAGYEVAASKAELFERADVLQLLVRLTADTKGIVTASRSGVDETDRTLRQCGARRADRERRAGRRAGTGPARLRGGRCL